MKIKKTISDKVIAANQENGKKGGAPHNTDAVGQNARTHGLLSNRLVFRNEEEQQEFAALLADLTDEHKPVRRTAREFVERIAFCFWQLAIAAGLDMQELTHRSKASAAILQTLAENEDRRQLPLFTQGDGSQSAAQLGWDLQELVVRTGTRNSEQQDEGSLGDNKVKSGHVQIEAKLNTSLDTILRYQAAKNRDLSHALAELRNLKPEKPGKRRKSVVRKDRKKSRNSRRRTRRKVKT